MMRNSIVFLGVPIDCVNMEETLDRIEQMVWDGRARRKTHQVATVNVDFLVKAIFDPELRYLLQHADLATADGMPLVWGARCLGVPLKGRVAGADIVPALAERAAQKGLSIFFLGAAPGIAAQAAAILTERNPGLRVAGIISPPYSPVLEMDPAILEEIQATQPDILLVAFGNPKQEKWIGMYSHQLDVPVMIGVGGSLDFIAKQTRRAPEWMQHTGLEWLYRLLQEPRRLLKRYVVDMGVFSWYFLQQWWVMRKRKPTGRRIPEIELSYMQQAAVLNFGGPVVSEQLQVVEAIGQKALEYSPHILANLERAEFFDSSAIGSLVELARLARAAGGDLYLVSVPQAIENNLVLLRLDKFFQSFPDIESYLVYQANQENNRDGSGLFQVDIIPEPIGNRLWAVLNAPRALDGNSAQEMLNIVSKLLAITPFFIIDLAETNFLMSAGLAAMADLSRMVLQVNGEFRVVNCSNDVMKAIRMARFDQALSIEKDFSLAAV